MSGRDISAHIYDALTLDLCMGDYLEPPGTTTHGSEEHCDQPVNQHVSRPVRREEQGWPGDFNRAVVTFGRLSRSPFAFNRVKWAESWTFVVGIWVRQTVVDDDGERSPGDLWAQDIYANVVRALAWTKGNADLDCTGRFLVFERNHEGDIVPLHYNSDLGAWEIQTRFRWGIVSRGLIAPVPACCEPTA